MLAKSLLSRFVKFPPVNWFLQILVGYLAVGLILGITSWVFVR
jgi:hypothetical protein